MNLSLAVPSDFSFHTAVCSHGFFVLAPNLWKPQEQLLHTAIALDDERAVVTRISMKRDRLAIHIPDCRSGLSSTDRDTIRSAVRRMLRLDEDLSPFHKLCRQFPSHIDAARKHFGRLLRGASLFEDMVKVICTCNIAWRQTVAMTARLATCYGAACLNDPAFKAFPTPARLTQASPLQLRKTCSLGYRAESISELSRRISKGELSLTDFESPTIDTERLYRRLLELRGIGPYAAANLCMLLGRYDRLAVDTEMTRFLKQQTGRPVSRATASRRYAKWQPYPFLAYWWELWNDYVARHGPAEQWLNHEIGSKITE